MKRILAAATVAIITAVSPVLADSTFMLGGTVSFGAGRQPALGITARLLENNQVDETTLGVGVTYYPGTADIGLDVFAGYVFDNGVFGLGYDFVQASPVISLGIADTED